MIEKELNLKAFSLENSLFRGEVKANLICDENEFTIHFQVFGNCEKIKIPSVLKEASRKDGLWEHTCFEFFLGIVNSPIYWEFNLSPSGNWNVYRFSDYRRGMKPEMAFSSLPFQFSQEKDHLSLKVTIDLSQIISYSPAIDIAITMVIEDEQSNISYWALKHPGIEADFHRRDSFIKEI